MKYTFHDEIIPQEARCELNDKILYIVDQDIAEQEGITREDIFNAYTGDGGLHGLKRSDFANYHEYGEAKKEIENGQFFTPPALCQFIMEALDVGMTDTVADLTFGMAHFANFMPVEANFYGCELDIKSHKVAHYLYPAANLEHKDIRFYEPDMRFDFVVGNPPFNLKWQVDDTEYISQMYYCLKAAQLLKPLGIMAIVVPASFLADEYLDGAKRKELERLFSFMGEVSLQSGVFSYLGVENYPTKIMFWQRKLNDTDTGSKYELNTANWFNLSSMNSMEALLPIIRTEVIAPAKLLQQQNSSLIKLSARSENNNFEYQVRKMMYHIRTNPKLADKYAKCQEYLYKFQHQVQPADMKYEEWAKIRITEAKVLAYLRRVVKSQHKKSSRDVIRLVKHDGGLIYKGYSKKAQQSMTEGMKQFVPFYALASGQMDSAGLEQYARLIRRKQRDYDRETQPFDEMEPDAEIARFLDEFTVYDNENEEWIHLNDTQKHDLNLILQKRYHLLQWEQGGGKTLAGIATGRYRMERQGARNVWVVSTAISIKNNWDLVFKNYGMTNYRMIRTLSDLDGVRDGEFVIITLNMLSKYRKQIKRHIKIRQRNVDLVFDESDEMTNPDSKRTKAVLDCFRKVRFKLEMTGTITRNNISESAPQLELLYNNSYNMISWAESLYWYEKDEDGSWLNSGSNPFYGKPIPAYKPGYNLFAESHLPEKITVFGVGKKTQDIYNADTLNRMLSYAVITRTFAEITGKEIRRIHQVPVSFSSVEREVYRKAVEEFFSLRQRYFALTGNSRKDSMMALIQQITLLLRISAAPNTVEEYDSTDLPVKLKKVCDMVAEWNDEVVVIGVRHKNVVEAYAEAIRQRFPERKLFTVTGSTTTLAGRRRLKKSLKESGNGIMVCTQQCLPSSVNFEFVNKVVIPELHYNNARMSQFYMRFVRFTSTDWKDIYFVTYSGSIESNQMQMVLAKEKLNLFMKGQDVNLDEVYNRFGVDYDLMSLLMSREVDDKGSSYLSWGKQVIE